MVFAATADAVAFASERNYQMKPCKCTPPVADPRFEAHIMTGGIGIFSRGHTVDEAVANVRKHAKKDRIPQREWRSCWVQQMNGNREVWAHGFSTPY